MSENYLSAILGFGVLGLIALGMGIWARLGYLRGLYLFKGIPGVHPSGYVYGFLPIGVGGIFVAFILLILDKNGTERIIGYSIWGFVFIFLISIIWRPRWLRPWWLKWLEDHYGHVLDGMLEEARNARDFEQQTPAEADLALWADSVAQKHGWQRSR